MQNDSNVELLREASRRVIREVGLLRPTQHGTGTTATQGHLLVELGRHGTSSALELAASLCVDKSNASRTLEQLKRRGLVAFERNTMDRRRKDVELTKKGRACLKRIHRSAASTVEAGLDQLDREEQELVLRGMALYANALASARLLKEVKIRKIRNADDPKIANIIRSVRHEYGVDEQDWLPKGDEALPSLTSEYKGPRCGYYVAVKKGQVVGGAGIVPLTGDELNTAELQRMYLLSAERGVGIGRMLFERCVNEAKTHGYKRLYMETAASLARAITLYERMGCEQLPRRIGATDHDGRGAPFVLDL